jgi:hypothetical protein
MNVFEWSLPFVTEKVLQIFGQLFQKNQKFDDEDDDKNFVLPPELNDIVFEP